MKRNVLVVLCALVSVYAVALISVAPARADQKSVNDCGKTIAKTSVKILTLFAKAFLACYTRRHACALNPATRDACLAATEEPGKACSCERLDVTNPLKLTGIKLAAFEAKIKAKCDWGVNLSITQNEVLYEDPKLCVGGSNPSQPCASASACPGGTCSNNPRLQLGYADRRDCKCSPVLGHSIISYADVEFCTRYLLLKAATSQVGWDTDPRAQGEIFDILMNCNIVPDDPCA